MKQEEVLQVFKEKNALLDGHFLLSSGLHSSNYLQCALVLQYPNIAEKFAQELVAKYTPSSLPSPARGEENLGIDVVVSPAIGGIVIGQEVARVFGCRAVFTEREEGVMKLRRGFSIEPGEKVVVVEDVITTGGSTKEVITVVKNAGAEVRCAMAVADRSAGKVQLEVPLIVLLELDIKSYSSEECPLCKRGIPVVKPGSKKVK